MNGRLGLVLALGTALAFPSLLVPFGQACCPASPSGKPVVNADQTVIIIWDQAAKMEHFIRKASFKSEAEDFGFLIPTPSEPQLDESGNEAFPFLLKLTEPETRTVPRPKGTGCGCGAPPQSSTEGFALSAVEVLSEKQVAGFNAVVLQAESAKALIGWLKEHGYVFSPEVEAWAKPYITAGWKITALKVVKDQSGQKKRNVAASSLRMSFKTDHPLFPYREPDSKTAAATLGASHRLLRIYFLGEARYKGQLTPTNAWTGHVVWANPLASENRSKLIGFLHWSHGLLADGVRGRMALQSSTGGLGISARLRPEPGRARTDHQLRLLSVANGCHELRACGSRRVALLGSPNSPAAS